MAERKWAYLASLGFAGMPPEKVVGHLAELGYSGVEWTLAHFNPRAHSPAELQRTVNVTVAAGLGVSELVAQQDLVTFDEAARKERIALTKDCVRACADCGIPAVNVFSGPAPWDPAAPKLGTDITEGAALDMAEAGFAEILSVAEDVGVDLALEAVFGMACRDYYTAAELLRRLPSPRMNVNMDPSHLALYRNDVGMAVRALGGRLVHVHLKDVIGVAPACGDTFLFPLLGEGLVDWPGFVGHLDAIGYDGYLSVEFESFKYYETVLKGDPVAAARLSMEQIRALMS